MPGPLLALAAAIVLVAVFGLDDHGVALIPSVPSGLPVPDLPPLDHVDELAPFALAIAFMAYFESVTAARIARTPDDPPLDNDEEYVAAGAASIAGAFFSTVPPAGGVSHWVGSGKLHPSVAAAVAAFVRHHPDPSRPS